uniref:20 kDa chaperonin, chloroplastic n=1 Tax=Trieres chinensis TaxID=1514140 RepID=A0A7S2EXS6_TRICV|mmetsp:Transcript_6529/g.13656  ORF Transcript_6529/g.13656 Transcript_6529/m.13656 type:complete len:253 (+) Transcript_6529:107-865(+)|eukprot:CAMPEP_0183306572 /NCGR_PEP_ID=MMETSP0160_2-20130417/12767_1 /TAXON_ID=2839 ORGANISM="Odontella Sinensis, Strain Grunow 1884" /NCGR_SAMPLE_ID=MMETSP0160_2 /ASSEMBLY_ACC=CAM_ASM_000250 /LENGTH=252 /DNA_ID=CAMNT_0025469983 /DNA_START=105 /DNA_END=863 /DNA_ORIENTATION=+
MRTAFLLAASAGLSAAFAPGRLPTSSSRRAASSSSSSSLSANTLEGREIASGGSIKPVNNFVLVELADIQDQTDSGILLSKTAKIVKTEGTVVAVGPGKYHPEGGDLIPMPVTEGDGVVYGKYDGTVVEYNDKRHSLIRSDDILVKFSGGKLTLDTADVCDDVVLVKPDETETETSGGLLLAAPKKGENQSRPSTGIVIRVGPGRVASGGERMEMSVSEGDRVKFRDFAGNEVDVDGAEYCVVRMSDVLAKF